MEIDENENAIDFPAAEEAWIVSEDNMYYILRLTNTVVQSTLLHSALYYTALHCTALHCTALHYTILYYTTYQRLGNDFPKDHNRKRRREKPSGPVENRRGKNRHERVDRDVAEKERAQQQVSLLSQGVDAFRIFGGVGIVPGHDNLQPGNVEGHQPERQSAKERRKTQQDQKYQHLHRDRYRCESACFLLDRLANSFLEGRVAIV